MSASDCTKKLYHLNSICGLLTFSGKDSKSFLNKLLISDLNSIPKNKFIYSALCNPKGRIISSLWIKIQDEQVTMILPKDNLALLDFFKMRTFRQDVQINTASENILLDLEEDTIKLAESAEEEFIPMDVDDYYLYLFRKGLVWIGAEYSEKFIPQHVNLDQIEHVMSFDKGCYPGQEIIARLKYLGKIKKRMTTFEFEQLTEAQIVHDDKNVVSPIVFNPTINQYQFQSIESVKS